MNHAPDTLPRTRDWTDDAACLNHTHVFFPRAETPATTATAKRICEVCPVRTACLNAAMAEEKGGDHHVRAGVRGGLNPAERAAKHRREARR